MTFILVLTLTMSGGQEIQRSTVKPFTTLESCQIYAKNHVELNRVMRTHPSQVQTTHCEKAK
jgi:hypothetical protein